MVLSFRCGRNIIIKVSRFSFTLTLPPPSIRSGQLYATELEAVQNLCLPPRSFSLTYFVSSVLFIYSVYEQCVREEVYVYRSCFSLLIKYFIYTLQTLNMRPVWIAVWMVVVLLVAARDVDAQEGGER